MSNEFLTILWTDTTKFDLKEHQNLQSAILYLVANGAKYGQQEIVRKVDWLPKEETKPQEKSDIIEEKKETVQDNETKPPFPIPSGPPTADMQPTMIGGPKRGEYRPLSVSERLGPLAGMIGPKLMGD